MSPQESGCLVSFVLKDFGDEKENNVFSKLKETMKNKLDGMNEWLTSIVFDINGSFDRFITDVHHPNHSLLCSYPKALRYHTEECKDQRYVHHQGDQWVHLEHGTIFEGKYTFSSTHLDPPIELFNPTGFTLLLRVFLDSIERSVVVMFGYSYRWFGITPYGISLNNGRQLFPFVSQLKQKEWNDVWVSFNNAQPPGSYDESHRAFTHKNTNPNREVFCIVNGKEVHHDVNVNLDVLSSTVILSDTGLQFIDYSCANCLTGFFSSLVLFNQSCKSFDELRHVASTFLKNHSKPTITYEELFQYEEIEIANNFVNLFSNE